MQSILEILVINEKPFKYKSGEKAGQPGLIREAHCVLRNDDGSAGAVGVLAIPKALDEVAKVGTFTAGFSLEAPTYGENAGKIVAALKSLTPVPAGRVPRAGAPS